MANRWKGNFVVATAATSSGTAYTGRANGAWGLNSQLQQKQGGIWATGISPPSAPTIGAALAGAGNATVSFLASVIPGYSGTITYTATSSPGGVTGNATSTPITVNGLSAGTAYTFTVTATNELGLTSVPSAPSNSVTPSSDVIGIGSTTSPWLSIYVWAGGFGTKYADPSPSVSAARMTFSPDNTVVAYSSHSSASVGAFSWSSVTGFGSKFSDPSTMPSGTSYNTKFNSQGTVLAVAHATSPYITTYPWSNGFGTKFSNPAIPLGDTARAVCFSPDGAVISIASISTVISSYAWNNGFGTKYADLAVTPFTPSGLGCDFSNSGATLIVSGYSTPYIAAYPWSNGYGTKYANPSTLPLQNCFWTKFNKDGSKIACGWQINSPFFYIYNWSNGFGSKLTDPSSGITGTASYAGDFGRSTANSNDIAIGQAGSPFINAYTFNSSSVGTKYANPSTLPPSDAYSVSFSN